MVNYFNSKVSLYKSIRTGEKKSTTHGSLLLGIGFGKCLGPNPVTLFPMLSLANAATS